MTAREVRYDFGGKAVVITGAARGLGRSHALGFAEAGADILISDIGESMATVPYALAGAEELERVAEEVREHGARCVTAICDVRRGDQVQGMIAAAIREFGKIDVLINNAGVESIYGLTEMPERAWREMIDTQLTGTFLCSQSAAVHMKEQGRGKILVTGSTSSFVAAQDQAHYVAAKSGVLGLTKAMAIDLAPFGINVNAVCPGATRTSMVDGILEGVGPGFTERLAELTGTWNLFDPDSMIEPIETTHAMLWLASDASDFVTGASILVDAGFTIK
jgi:NAD(P)-dependent dehydrogenase (short-subunit alcohol dehydrogenase family)